MYKTLISCDTLHNHLDDNNLLIVDCRYDLMDKDSGKHAYYSGHIPGAIYLDVHHDLSGPPITNRGRHPLPTEAKMNQLLSRVGINKDTQVVVYDSSYGAFAARFWWMCQHMQHDAVAVLDGGWQAWLDAGYPISDKHPEITESTYQANARQEQVVSIDNVMEYQRIVDSREPPRFRGESEPIDPVAGHIPGAINRFWKENLQEDGKFKSKSELSEAFSELLQDNSVQDTVIYCGSGVTACHNILAAFHAEVGLPKLYAGSWSEWSNKPEKPIATSIENTES